MDCMYCGTGVYVDMLSIDKYYQKQYRIMHYKLIEGRVMDPIVFLHLNVVVRSVSI